jgi:hypothetical protein
MGFKTFQEFWNEGYDGSDGATRYQQILQLIDWIAQQPLNTLVDMYQSMQPILDHNYNLLMDWDYDRNITKIARITKVDHG